MSNPSNKASALLDRINHKNFIEALRVICGENGGERFGCVLAIAVVHPDTEVTECVSVSIGLPGLKFGRYARNAAEKINRLFERRMEGNDEVAASESADDILGTYGGCIFFKGEAPLEVYISFSGAPPEVDEALAFVIGEKLGLMTPTYENPLIPRIRELLDNLV